jgi:hypothetical protein
MAHPIPDSRESQEFFVFAKVTVGQESELRNLASV